MRKWFTGVFWLEKLPLYKAVLWILGFTFIVSGSASLSIIYYKHLQDMRTHDAKYAITTIIQQCRSGKELPTDYLAELLSLSVDQPYHLYKWNTGEAEKTLRGSPFIKKAFIEKLPPNTVKITYFARTPVATVGDLDFSLIDREGHLLPALPFYSESSLPKLILGVERVKWGARMIAPEVTLALEVKHALEEGLSNANLEVVDVSRAFARSAGKRQIIVTLKPEGKTRILRLTAQNYLQQLANYQTLAASGKLDPYPSVSVDLRLDHLAYLQPIEPEGEKND